MLKMIQNLDQKSVTYLNNLIQNWGFWNKLFTEYMVYSMPVIMLWLWLYDQKSKKVAMRGFMSVILAWPVLAYIIGKFVSRPRPFELGGIHELIFHRPTYSFPSDHAAALFAFAFSLWFSGYKKLGGFCLGIAIVVSSFRVATGLHWPTDIIAGAVVGLIAAYLIDLFDKPLNIIYDFIIKIAKKLRLA
jgi:undecaprenyl-diphosphatase